MLQGSKLPDAYPGEQAMGVRQADATVMLCWVARRCHAHKACSGNGLSLCTVQLYDRILSPRLQAHKNVRQSLYW